MAIPSQAQLSQLYQQVYGTAPLEGDEYTYVDSEHYIEYSYENFVWVPQRTQQVFENSVLPVVNRYNGLSGDVVGVSSVVGSTGIALTGTTGAVTISNIGVLGVNGATGAVQLSSTYGLTFSVSGTSVIININTVDGGIL